MAGGAIMTIFDEKSASPDGPTNDETPLLSRAGRDFLDGKLDVEVYVERARGVASEKAKRDIYLAIAKDDQKRRRRVALTGFLPVTIAYAVLGIYSFASKTGAIVTVGAATTALVAAFVTFDYGRHADIFKRFIFHVLENVRPQNNRNS
jgi:hypothetical protein